MTVACSAAQSRARSSRAVFLLAPVRFARRLQTMAKRSMQCRANASYASRCSLQIDQRQPTRFYATAVLLSQCRGRRVVAADGFPPALMLLAGCAAVFLTQ